MKLGVIFNFGSLLLPFSRFGVGVLLGFIDTTAIAPSKNKVFEKK